MNINNPLIARDYDFLEVKIEWIEITYLSLLRLLIASGKYSEDWRPELEKFSDYLGRIGCEEICGLFMKVRDSLDKNCDQDHSALADHGDLADFEISLQRLSSPSYEAPSEEDEIFKDLGLLWAYWETCRFSKTYSVAGVPEAGLDMALVKLSKNIGGLGISAMVYNKYILPRTAKSTLGHRKRMKGDAQLVKDIFFRLKFLPKTKLHRVALMIQEELHPKPSLDTIKNILRSYPETKPFFRQKGRFWIYESVTLS